MQMQQTMPRRAANLLRRALLGNATFSMLIGLLCLSDANLISAWLGLNEPTLMSVIGGGILLGAAWVAWVATRPQLDRKAALLILCLDVAWVIASVILLVTGWVAFSGAGKWLVIGVTDVVALFALLEYLGLRQARTER